MVLFTDLPDKRYDIIYCDPPWDYKGQLQHSRVTQTGGAIKHYDTLTLEQLKKFPIHKIMEYNCLLFMWATSPHLDQAIELGKSWGFQWATVGFVWDKLASNPGFYTMSNCELVLIFKHGRIPTPRGSRSVKQLVRIKRTKHSEKPTIVRKKIESMFPTQSKIELFAREIDIEGWDRWGNIS